MKLLERINCYSCGIHIGYIEGPKGSLGGPKYYCDVCGGKKIIEEREKERQK